MPIKHFLHLTCGLILASAVAVNLHNLHHPVQRGGLVSSEVQGTDEFPITCAPDDSLFSEAGSSLQYISGVLPSNQYALNSAFITAAALNSSSCDPVYWADNYYNNPLSYYYQNPTGAVYRDDLITWWGTQTFSPMAPIAPDFCLIWQCMDIEHRALLLEDNGFVWAVGTLAFFPDTTPGGQSMCEYTYVNANNQNWGIGDINRISTDEFYLTVYNANLYLAGSN